METWILVMCIIMTFGSVISLLKGFKETVETTETKQLSFVITVGMLIWGWILYF